MRVMVKAAAAACVLLAATASAANPWDGTGPLMAQYYNEEMSIPKGWSLSYAGKENGVDVFLFDSDFDAHPMTSIMSAEDQLRRLVCGDDTVAKWFAAGFRVRADQRALRGGKRTTTKGTPITRC